MFCFPSIFQHFEIIDFRITCFAAQPPRRHSLPVAPLSPVTGCHGRNCGIAQVKEGSKKEPQQNQSSCCDNNSQQQQLQPAPTRQDAFQLSQGQQMQPIPPNRPSQTGAPKPNFTLNRPKPPSKGFKQEVKSLLNADKKNSITIEKKSK